MGALTPHALTTQQCNIIQAIGKDRSGFLNVSSQLFIHILIKIIDIIPKMFIYFCVFKYFKFFRQSHYGPNFMEKYVKLKTVSILKIFRTI